MTFPTIHTNYLRNAIMGKVCLSLDNVHLTLTPPPLQYFGFFGPLYNFHRFDHQCHSFCLYQFGHPLLQLSQSILQMSTFRSSSSINAQVFHFILWNDRGRRLGHGIGRVQRPSLLPSAKKVILKEQKNRKIFKVGKCNLVWNKTVQQQNSWRSHF